MACGSEGVNNYFEAVELLARQKEDGLKNNAQLEQRPKETNYNSNNKTEWWLQEGGPDTRIKVILVKLDAVWLWKRRITHPVLLNNFYIHTHKERKKKKESLICRDFMRVIVLTVHKSKQE